MGKIFCIMGKSSSGKDTIYKLLLKREDLNLEPIVLYTTRPIRDNEIDGEEYHFVDESKLRELENAGKVIECRCYDTVFGPWYYFTAADDQVDLDKKDYMAIGTVDSFVSFKDFYGEDKVVPIYIEVEDGIRLSRALNREMSQDKPKYEEMCRRFLADQQDFSQERLDEAGVCNVFNNNADRAHTTETIAAFILEKR